MSFRNRARTPAMSPDEFKRTREEVLEMTQVELARELGLSDVQIWRYEKGLAPVDESRARALRLLVESKAASKLAATEQ